MPNEIIDNAEQNEDTTECRDFFVHADVSGRIVVINNNDDVEQTSASGERYRHERYFFTNGVLLTRCGNISDSSSDEEDLEDADETSENRPTN